MYKNTQLICLFYRGMSSEEAEINYLKNVSTLQLYGIDLHHSKVCLFMF